MKEQWFSNLSPQLTTGAYRSVTRLAGQRQDSRLRSGPPPTLAGTLPPLPSRAPGPPGQTLSSSLSGAPFRSLRFVGHATHPLSLPPGFPSHPLSYGTSVRSGHKGRYSNLIRGPLFRERRRSFARDPLTPLARPGSIRPLSGTPLSYLPLAHPLRFAPFRLPQGRLPCCKVSRRAFVATPAPRLFLDLLPALAWKSLFGCLRETSCAPVRPQGLPR